jgi:hypothetical protein
MLTKLGYHSLEGGTARTLTHVRFRRWPIAIITTLAGDCPAAWDARSESCFDHPR